MKRLTAIIILSTLFLSAYSQRMDKQSEAYFLFNFGRLLKWQNYPDNQFVINVYGTSNVTDFINNMALTNIAAGRKVIAREATQDNLSNCNILFITSDGINDFETIINSTTNLPVLIVTENRGYINSGADVEFGFKTISATDSVLSYRVNERSIKSKNIKISPDFMGYSIF